MTAFDPATRLQRLEQQLAAFERLHADELRELQRRLETYLRLHEDEVRLLRAEIADLRAALDAPGGSARAGRAAAVPPPAPLSTAAPAPPASAHPEPATADPEIVEEAAERVVESALEQTVSRRKLLGGHADE
jgi:hypothetical protein